METKDEQLYAKLDYNLLRRLVSYLRPYRLPIAGALLLTVASAVLAPLRPFLSTQAIDVYVATGDAGGLLRLILVIFGILLLHAALQFALTYIMQWVGQKTLNDVRQHVYAHIQSLSLRFYDVNPVGRLVTRATNDVEALNELFSSGLVLILSDILLVCGIVAYMFFTSWKLALITLLILPILFGATIVFRKKVRLVYSEIRKQIARLNTFLNENISGISTIQLFSREQQQFNEFDSINKKHADNQIRSIFYYAVFFPVVEFLTILSLCLMLWYVSRSLFSGEITVGVLVAFVQFAEMFFRPIRDLTEKYNTLQSAMAASERIFGLLDTKAQLFRPEKPIDFLMLCNEIEFRDVSFSYDGIFPVLKNVSFTVKKGETVAIVGATGAGKSSVINLLSRFYEFQSGDILLDGISIRDMSPERLRQRMAVVLQDPFLFSRTIRENISMGKKDVSPDDVENTAMLLGIDDFIRKLPNGYDEPLNERGANISSGQKQLLSFCRAFIANPDILILDEATSNIDTETEQLLEKSLQTLLKGRTSIVIAHRLSTIQRADNILVMHRGELREQGNHQELLRVNGIYAKLYRLQYQNQDIGHKAHL